MTRIITLVALIALSSPTTAYAQSCCMSQDEQNTYAHDADRAQQEAQERQAQEQAEANQRQADMEREMEYQRESNNERMNQMNGGY